jgi:hypothetical protein
MKAVRWLNEAMEEPSGSAIRPIEVIKGENMNTQANRDEKENVMAVEVELSVEEMEEVIAPGVDINHNEALVSDKREVELSVEEMEEVIAPGIDINH